MNLRLLTLLVSLLCSTAMWAVSKEELMQLEADMLKYMGTNERDTFFVITEKLKNFSRKEGDDKLFYKAWSNQSVYEATQQYYDNAIDIARKIKDYAREDGSVYGEYAAIHTEAMVLLEKQDYEPAEQAFLKAVDFHHRRFPNESAAEDLRELMKIAYIRKDIQMARNYANQLLSEPNLAPHHKGRILYRLSIIAFDENNVEEFNHVYDEMDRLTHTDGIKTQSLYNEVNYNIINGNYKHALILADRLSADTCAERKAIIYHRLGDNEKAYEYMRLYKQISDSILNASHNNLVANLYLRMNNDRLRIERELLTNKNTQLYLRFYIAVGTIFILVLLFMIYKRRKIIKLLKHDNSMLISGKKGAERALKDLNELSLFESKEELPLTMPVKLNRLCDYLTNIAQKRCNKGVITMMQSDFPDDYEIKSNSAALEKLLSHLLDCSVRFAYKGYIILKCADAGEFVKFVITDTSHMLNDKSKEFKEKTTDEQQDTVRYISMNISICQSISRLLHGRIWHDMEYTDGTRFCFEIPKEP